MQPFVDHGGFYLLKDYILQLVRLREGVIVVLCRMRQQQCNQWKRKNVLRRYTCKEDGCSPSLYSVQTATCRRLTTFSVTNEWNYWATDGTPSRRPRHINLGLTG